MDQSIRLVRSKNYHTLTLTTPVAIGGGGSSEPGDYDGLTNKPSINGVILQGNLTWRDLGLPDYGDIPKQPLSNAELNEITGRE